MAEPGHAVYAPQIHSLRDEEGFMRTVRFTGAMLLAIVLASAGCGTYYRVTDPNSGRVYYTDDVKRGSQGAVQFKDAKSGADVTLQASEVLEISSDDFKKNTAK